MKLYADTNFFGRIYLGLPIRRDILEWFHSLSTKHPVPMPVTWLHQSELCNALQLYVFRGRAGLTPRITPERSGAAWAQFREELRNGELSPANLSVSELVEQAEELSLRHSARYGFRAYDVLHVSSALLLGCDVFLSFDAQASRLAKLEGLKLQPQ